MQRNARIDSRSNLVSLSAGNAWTQRPASYCELNLTANSIYYRHNSLNHELEGNCAKLCIRAISVSNAGSDVLFCHGNSSVMINIHIAAYACEYAKLKAKINVL